MATRSIVTKKRFPWLPQVLQIEQVLLFIGLVIYALLASLNQGPSLWVIMLAIFTIGNLVTPLALLVRRIYVRRSFPWNWIVLVPVQIGFGFICAVGSIVLLQVTKIDQEPFRAAFRRMGYLAIVVVLVANVVGFAVEEFQRKLKERNALLEQTVEKGTIALQQQEEELKRAREIQQMLLPNSLPQLAGAQIAGAWQPAREVSGTTSM